MRQNKKLVLSSKGSWKGKLFFFSFFSQIIEYYALQVEIIIYIFSFFFFTLFSSHSFVFLSPRRGWFSLFYIDSFPSFLFFSHSLFYFLTSFLFICPSFQTRFNFYEDPVKVEGLVAMAVLVVLGVLVTKFKLGSSNCGKSLPTALWIPESLNQWL